MNPDDWRTPAFRQNMINKIEELIQQFQTPMTRNATDMENHVYTRAKSRDEYIGYITKVLMFIKSNKKNPPGEMVQGTNNINPVVQQKGMQDPIGALQSLARQGTGNNNMGMQGPGPNPSNINQQIGPGGNIASNLLQSLNKMNPGQPVNIQQALQNKITGINMLQNQQLNLTQMGQMQNMQSNSMMNPMNQGNMPQQMGPQLGNQQQQMGVQQMGSNQIQHNMQMKNQISGHQLGNQINPGMQSMMQPQQSASQQQHQHMNQMNATQINVNQMSQQLAHMQRKPVDMMNANYPGQRNMTPNQFLNQSPSPSVPSPGGLSAPGSNQMVPSPALVPSPNPQHAMLGGQRSIAMAPSPSSSLNTPAGIIGGTTHSPVQDEQISQACREKIQKLRKYIEPLNRTILKLTNDGYTEKTIKMKRLLEILTNPSIVTNLETLRKCEQVLEKMDLERRMEASVGPAIPSTMSEFKFLSPLFEAVRSLLQTPTPNHTLHRTFGPCLQSLFGPEIKNLPPPLKRQKIEETPSEIPDVLQGEIARLDQRFKISLDPTQQNGSKCIQLICWLDDKHLPCVPPVLITVPADYPTVPPKCVLTSHEYTTPYLNSVQKALDARLAKLPRRYSVSQILDNWEMSVRKACAPSKIQKVEELNTTSSAMTGTTKTTTSTTNASLTNGLSTNLINSIAS
ncbi:mediator of RNA polymerase II transcription subunit 15 isoform X2 [Phymastichus coffea]|uniref:mediator of RNA polymerase II transcription subunit 15 isoform X2 n=1 Tax=Phymastichus coffea TaxID=108790 RepID=UPI00273BEA76|nr:mediator of RNA polymerase II transcription subunit 15 isoform X2 [Phymastichus coffea]